MTTILIKKKDTAGAPAPGDLTNAAGGAEIAVNTATKRIYTKDSGGTVVEVGTNPSALTTNLLFSPDATYDIGASGASRPRNLFLSGAATLGTALTVPNGGTGLTTLATGSLSYGAGTSAFSTLAIGTAGQILTVNSGATAPQWSTLSGVAVTTFSAGTTGFTPSSATAGAVTLAGTLNVANGGTGLTSLTSGLIPYGNGTSAFSSSASFKYDGANLGVSTTIPPNTVYPGIFLAYQTNLISIGGEGGLYYNIYGVGTQLKWQTSSLGGSKFTFGPSSFTWAINPSGGTADTNASLTQYMSLDNTGLTVTGKVAATADVTSSGSGATYPLGGLGVVGTASGSYGGIYTLGGTSCTLYFDHRGTGNTGQFVWRNGTGGATTLMNLDSNTLSSYGSNLNVGNNVAATNVNITLKGVASKAKRIVFTTSGAESWLIGMGAASETDAFEIYNGNGNMTVSINKSTSVSSFGAGIQITPNNVAYANTSAFMVQGYTYSSDFSVANATAQIIGTRMTNNDWNPTLNIVTARQSLTAGSLSFGGIGFTTIDASNSSGMFDAARIAIVNESTSAVASPTAMAFYTNVGSATNTYPANERARLTSLGNLLVGQTSESPLSTGGNLIVNGAVLNGQTSGNISYPGTADFVTFANGTSGIYLMQGRQSGAPNGGIYAIALVVVGTGTGTLTVTNLTTASMSFGVSGTARTVNVTNTAGGTLGATVSWIRLMGNT
jgi:hypothetical protein